MRKQYNIRWRPADIKTITNLVRQFNAKITRTINKNPDSASYLPERISTATLKNRIETRQDFNRIVNEYKRFLNKGAENPYHARSGLVLTQWEKRETGIKVGIINRRRRAQLIAAAPSTIKGTMGTIRDNSLLHKKYNVDTITPENWKKFIESVNKQSYSNYMRNQLQLYKSNYIKSVHSVFGGSEYESAIMHLLYDVPIGFFSDAMYDNPYLGIDFVYDEHDMEIVAQKLIQEWKQYLQ